MGNFVKMHGMNTDKIHFLLQHYYYVYYVYQIHQQAKPLSEVCHPRCVFKL